MSSRSVEAGIGLGRSIAVDTFERDDLAALAYDTKAEVAHALDREQVAHVPFVNDTSIVFVIDLPQLTVSITTEQMIRWEREMRLAFVDVRAGDRITGVYLPGEGARFYVGEKLQHVVRDEAFAKAFFAIWLDPRTRNPELRAQLLGAAKP